MSDLKELLHAISDHAGVFDVTERAFVLGRRRRTRQRTAFAGAATTLAVTALLVAVNLPARPAPEPAITPVPSPSPSMVGPSACTPAELPLPEGVRNDDVFSIHGDPTGRVLAARAWDAKGAVLVVWVDGASPTVVPWPDGATSVDAVSSTGAVLMTVENGTKGGREKSKTWVYRDGKVTRLSGTGALGLGINATGTIVGLVADNQLVTWSDADAEPVLLPVPDGMTAADPMAIADDGTIAAQLYEGRLGPKPAYRYSGPGWGYVWPPGGSPQRLRVPDTLNGLPVDASRAFAVADGWAAGNIGGGKNEARLTRPTRWNLATGEVEVLAAAERVSPHGWSIVRKAGALTLVGWGTAVPVPPMPGHPISRNGVRERLNVYVVSPDGRVLAGIQDVTPMNGLPAYLTLRWTCR
ncbi:hypothetical protein [Catellatospora paridis]|uniref:hypothetical protein n=1 Tax=Catellatospora paridis TaxID=1617086 RepID=UPI0012D4986D|nr:hypothetical protein [Catellatospora paridis]